MEKWYDMFFFDDSHLFIQYEGRHTEDYCRRFCSQFSKVFHIHCEPVSFDAPKPTKKYYDLRHECKPY